MGTRNAVVRALVLLSAVLLFACGGSVFKDGAHTTQPAVRNLVVIVVDGIRADALDAPDTSLALLKSRATSGIQFGRAYSPAPSTNAAVASMLTGLASREHGCRDGTRTPTLPAAVTTYAETLRDQHGYETVAFAPDRWQVARRNSVLQGFAAAPTRQNPLALGQADAAMKAWLAERVGNQPFCLLLHADMPNLPNEATLPDDSTSDWDALATADLPAAGPARDRAFARAYLASRTDRDRLTQQYGTAFRTGALRYMATATDDPADEQLVDALRDAYRRGLREVDATVDRAIKALRSRGLLDNTLLVVTSTHGQAFREHGTLASGQHVHAELSRVPLLVWGLPTDRRADVDETVSTLDVFPTFFDLAGLPLLDDREGRSLVAASSIEPRVVTSEVRVTERTGGPAGPALWIARRSRDWSFLISYDIGRGAVQERLYRGADLAERRNLAQTGDMRDADFSPSFCAAVDDARDMIWSEVDSAQARVGTVYGAGIEVVRARRPRPCGATR